MTHRADWRGGRRRGLCARSSRLSRAAGARHAVAGGSQTPTLGRVGKAGTTHVLPGLGPVLGRAGPASVTPSASAQMCVGGACKHESSRKMLRNARSLLPGTAGLCMHRLPMTLPGERGAPKPPAAHAAATRGLFTGAQTAHPHGAHTHTGLYAHLPHDFPNSIPFSLLAWL